jgi:hypothetical protein
MKTKCGAKHTIGAHTTQANNLTRKFNRLPTSPKNRNHTNAWESPINTLGDHKRGGRDMREREGTGGDARGEEGRGRWRRGKNRKGEKGLKAKLERASARYNCDQQNPQRPSGKKNPAACVGNRSNSKEENTYDLRMHHGCQMHTQINTNTHTYNNNNHNHETETTNTATHNVVRAVRSPKSHKLSCKSRRAARDETRAFGQDKSYQNHQNTAPNGWMSASEDQHPLRQAHTHSRGRY